MASEPSVLIVDDDVGILETMSDILKDHCFNVAIADNGYMAIELIRENTFDVILMDIKMPGIDGVETYRRIKRFNPQAKVIFMTAYAHEDRLAEAKFEGASAILYKPFDIDNLEKLIRASRMNGCNSRCYKNTQ